jgi:hypothetical protein
VIVECVIRWAGNPALDIDGYEVILLCLYTMSSSSLRSLV